MREAKEEREKEREREDKRAQEEFKLKTEQIALERERLKQAETSAKWQSEEHARKQSLVSRIKFFQDALKGSIAKSPVDGAELPNYFCHLERLFATVSVDKDVQASLLLSHLNDKARTLSTRLTTAQLTSYQDIKAFLLKEYRISPIQLRERFMNTRKTNDETFVALASRLRTTLDYYVQSRQINGEYETLMNLLCADRLKELVPTTTLNYILTQEGSKWLKADDLANALDNYVATRYAEGGLGRGTNGSTAQGNLSQKGLQSKWGGDTQRSPQVGNKVNWPKVDKDEALKKGLCFKCGGADHRSKQCGQAKGGGATNPSVKTQACAVLPTEDTPTEPHETGKGDDEVPGALDRPYVRTMKGEEDPQNFVIDTPEFYARTYVPVELEGIGVVQCLIDSGSEVACVNQSLVRHLQLPVHKQIRILGVHGHTEIAHVVQIRAKPVPPESSGLTNIAPAVRIWFAAVEGLTEEAIITPGVYSALQEASAYSVMASQARPTEDTIPEQTALHNSDGTNPLVNEGDDGKSRAEICPEVVDAEEGDVPAFMDPDVPSSIDELRSADTETLALEQRNCVQLKPCFEQAKRRQNNFFVKNNLLYRRERIVGHNIDQLCLPQSRIDTVLALGHDSGAGGHMGYKTTKDRIRLNFWWPLMDQRVQTYCATCPVCQLRAPIKTAHRIPIKPIPRNDEMPFSFVQADCIGPLMAENDPCSSKPAFNYALVIVDRFSRWPMAYPLKSLSAKAVCDAYIQMFMTFSIPKVIASDCGSNFKSKLTQEMLKRLGCSPRFSSPGHPEANGLVERCNSSIKTMIYKLAQDNPKGWHLLLPYVLWALRERPSSTLHVSPYMMVYGTIPRGPLSILKESWIGERELPLSLGKTAEEYLQDLKTNLEMARAYAEFYTEYEQRKSTEYYNLRSMDRRYTVGEKVIVLAPDPKGAKFFNRWQGPGTVVEVKSPYSYLVEVGDKRRHVHANKIRKYHERIQSALVNNCSVIFDSDEAFGRVEPISADERTTIRPSRAIDQERVEHLSDDQRAQLFAVLDRHAAVFSDKPGYCDLIAHEIKLLPGYQPKRFRAYRVPELLKPEVSRQIKQMLELNIISPSHSETASPLVCVMKGPDGKGGVRLAVDYRHVNQFSQGDRFPSPDVQDVLQRVGKARYISCFDANSGFWQLGLHPNSRHLSAFVCDDGFFEFNRMSFGLKSASNTFIRCVSLILEPVKDFAEPFVDDMAVHSMTWEKHLEDMDAFLATILKSGLTLNLKKCSFARSSTVFVGHVIGSGRIEPDPRKLECIGDIQPPKTKKEVRSIIGFFSYFRTFIPGLAETAHALTSLTQKNMPNKVEWSPRLQEALDKLKQDLSNAVKLYTVDFTKEFGLSVDASGVAVGCCLFQWSPEGVERPVAFASSKLTDVQTRWATIEREAYGCIWALKRFRAWVFLGSVTIFSDHNPLTFLTEAAPKSAKLTRWALALQEFQIQFRFRPGRHNLVADFLSRI